MLRAGVEQASHKLALLLWGFSHLGRQTECRESPDPRIFLPIKSGERHLWRQLHPLRLLRIRPSRSSVCSDARHIFLDDTHASDSSELRLNRYYQRNISSLFCAVERAGKMHGWPILAASFAARVGIFYKNEPTWHELVASPSASAPDHMFA